jgi:hypothetical protein
LGFQTYCVTIDIYNMEEKINCENCHKLINGNRKKRFCSDNCRVDSHRNGKWIAINRITKEQWEVIIKIRELWKQN